MRNFNQKKNHVPIFFPTSNRKIKMNKSIPLFLLLIIFVIIASCVPTRHSNDSQRQVDDIIYHTECPDKKLHASITAIHASRSKQSITVDFQVVNQGATIRNTRIASEFGNIPNGTKLIYNGSSYKANSVTYAGNVNGIGDLMTDVPLKGSLTFSGILPEGNIADYVSFMVRFQCELGFKNVSFEWGR